MGAVGSYDPDADEKYEGLQKARPKGTTDLQRRALAATGHTSGRFSGNDQKKRFTAIEVKAAGADEQSRMVAAWVRHNIQICETHNKYRTERSLWWLIKAISNEDRMTDWIAANRKRLLEQEKQDMQDMFARD